MILNMAGGSNATVDRLLRKQEYINAPTTQQLPFYWVMLDDGTVIGSYPNQVGIFEYKNNTWRQVYSAGTQWQYYQLVPGGVLIGSAATSGNNGLVFYDTGTGSATKVWSSGDQFLKFQPVAAGCLCSCASNYQKLLLFNTTTKTVEIANELAAYWYYFQPVNGGCLIGPTGGSGGYFFYSDDTHKAERALESSVGFTNFQVVPGGCFTSVPGSSNSGLHFWDETTQKDVVISLTNGSNWSIVANTAAGYLLGSKATSTTAQGIYLYDPVTRATTQPYSTGFGWGYAAIVLSTGECLLGSYSTVGVLFFDSTSKTATLLNTSRLGSYSRWMAFCEIAGGCLMGAQYSSSGCMFFRTADKTVVPISTANAFFAYVRVEKGAIGCLWDGGSWFGAYMFIDEQTLTITPTNIASAGTSAGYPLAVTGGALLVTSIGIQHFDTTTQILSAAFANTGGSGQDWAFRTKVLDGYVLASQYYAYGGFVYYDETSKSIFWLSNSTNASGAVTYQVTGGLIIISLGVIILFDESVKQLRQLYALQTHASYWRCCPVGNDLMIACLAAGANADQYRILMYRSRYRDLIEYDLAIRAAITKTAISNSNAVNRGYYPKP